MSAPWAAQSSPPPLYHDDVARFHTLVKENKLVHPVIGFYESEWMQDRAAPTAAAESLGPAAAGGTSSTPAADDALPPVMSFADLAAGLAYACTDARAVRHLGAQADGRKLPRDLDAARRIGQRVNRNRHVIFVLCDGMGTAVLERHLLGGGAPSFLLAHNQPSRLRSIFPATTPAALTTLATAVWPGQHGAPGWDLRDQLRVEYPNEAGKYPENLCHPVQLTVLDAAVANYRAARGPEGGPAPESRSLAAQWGREIAAEVARDGGAESTQTHSRNEAMKRIFVADPAVCHRDRTGREVLYISAYEKSEFSRFTRAEFSGRAESHPGAVDGTAAPGATLHRAGPGDRADPPEALEPATEGQLEDGCCDNIASASMAEVFGRGTLESPEGPAKAVAALRDAVDQAIQRVRKAEGGGKRTFTYIYTAHPDKHMHALGVEHAHVREVVRGFDRELARLWAAVSAADGARGAPNVCLLVTADHGHITVDTARDMVLLPDDVTPFLDYACVGAKGKGRHAVFHCKCGLQADFHEAWRRHPELVENFLLFPTDVAAGELGLFGPERFIDRRVRPRLGDFVAVALNARTLVFPAERAQYEREGVARVGAHGSLTPEEVRIPFVFLETP